MAISRQLIREYVEASENLLSLNDLTDEEIEAVQEMLDRVAEMLPSEHKGKT